jgi:hypothetical protein
MNIKTDMDRDMVHVCLYVHVNLCMCATDMYKDIL